MIVELNGLAFNLNVALDPDTKRHRVRIVDEAFMFEELHADARNRADVINILEAYSGMQVDTPTMYQLHAALP